MTSFRFGGVDLSTLGKITEIDGYLDLPDRRGNDIKLPFRHGTLPVYRYYDEREISFGISVTELTLSALESKLKTIQALLSPQAQQTLSITYEDGTTRTVQAIVNKRLQVRRSHTMARIVVDFTMATPFFRLSTAIADNTTVINADPKSMTVTNPGSIEERDPVITIDGPFTVLTIVNATNGCILTYTGTIGAAENVVIQTNSTGEYTAVLSTGSANVIGNISHSGASALMVFNPGDNSLLITNTGGDNTGSVKASFYAPYL